MSWRTVCEKENGYAKRKKLFLGDLNYQSRRSGSRFLDGEKRWEGKIYNAQYQNNKKCKKYRPMTTVWKRVVRQAEQNLSQRLILYRGWQRKTWKPRKKQHKPGSGIQIISTFRLSRTTHWQATAGYTEPSRSIDDVNQFYVLNGRQPSRFRIMGVDEKHKHITPFVRSFPISNWTTQCFGVEAVRTLSTRRGVRPELQLQWIRTISWQKRQWFGTKRCRSRMDL